MKKHEERRRNTKISIKYFVKRAKANYFSVKKFFVKTFVFLRVLSGKKSSLSFLSLAQLPEKEQQKATK